MTAYRPGRRAALLATVAALLAGCADREPPLRVGAKDFAEQHLLAAMAAELLRAEGFEVAPTVDCGDSYTSQAMLREGRVDLMADYSGTGLYFLGEPAAGHDGSLGRVRELYRPLGLRWLGPLGFDNSYCLLVPSDRAAARGLGQIDDLADPSAFPGGIRVACPPEYLRRPGDGLAALGEAYGLVLDGPPLVIADVVDRARAVREGRADVLVGYRTDGVIFELGLRELEDRRGFFPPYEAAFVIREGAIRRHPGIAAALGRLEGRLDLPTMRLLNDRVEAGGHRPAEVARGFLREQGLLPEGTGPGTRDGPPGITVAIAEGDRLGTLREDALLAVRRAFPGLAVRPLGVADPVQAVARGEARLALVGAERFFAARPSGLPDRESRAVAAAVVGTRILHVVRRADDLDAGPLSGTVGLPPGGSGAGRVAAAVLAAGPDDPGPTLRGEPGALLEAVAAGRADAALVLAAPGDPGIAGALAGGTLALAGLPGWLTPSRAVRLPYLRAARIPGGTYAGQDAPVEALGAQVVLAGASPGRPPLSLGGGPASALAAAATPLSPEQVEALARATGVPEAPAPTLPSAWADVRPPAEDPGPGPAALIAKILLNLLAIAFLAWLVLLARVPSPS